MTDFYRFYLKFDEFGIIIYCYWIALRSRNAWNLINKIKVQFYRDRILSPQIFSLFGRESFYTHLHGVSCLVPRKNCFICADDYPTFLLLFFQRKVVKIRVSYMYEIKTRNNFYYTYEFHHVKIIQLDLIRSYSCSWVSVLI